MENKVLTCDIKIIEPETKEHFTAARQLFKEYFDFLYTLPDMHMQIDMQKPDAELAELENGKYSPPYGAILLAEFEDEFIGSVGLRKLTNEICEMKRLYVRPKLRGASIGLLLAEHIIRKGIELGYEKMCLDTHPEMTKAHQLYYSLGFYDIPRYNQNMVPNALFMELILTSVL